LKNPETPTGPILAVDPGRDKCGVAVVEPNGRVLHKAVAATENIAGDIRRLVGEYQVERLVLGDRTAANTVMRALRHAHLPLSPILVDEHRSSELGRKRYFQENPPRGWRRLLPLTLQTPPRPYDDYVAVVLAERYLASLQAV